MISLILSFISSASSSAFKFTPPRSSLSLFNLSIVSCISSSFSCSSETSNSSINFEESCLCSFSIKSIISSNLSLLDSSDTSILPLLSLREDSLSDNSLIFKVTFLRSFSNSVKLSLSSFAFFLDEEIFSLRSIFFASISSGSWSKEIFSSSNFFILFFKIEVCSSATSFLLATSAIFFLFSCNFS